MAVDVTATCESLHAQYTDLVAQLAALPLANGSEGGRSLSFAAGDIEKRLQIIEERAARLGCPIGTMNEPAVVHSRGRA